MGQCLRGKMSDAGLIPAPATAVAAPTTAPAGEVAIVEPEPATPAPESATAEPATDVAEPALDVTPAAPAAEVPNNLIAATFGLLRAEPDGSVVIAGSGTPGSEVEVYSNGELLGKTTVENSGDWVFVPDAPLPTGGVEITLGETGKAGRAPESFVVAISEDKTAQPLVVASTPGAASEVLQGLEPPAAGTTTDVAVADPVTPPAPSPTPTPAAPAIAAPATAAPEAPPAVAAAEPVPVEVTPDTPTPAQPAPGEPAAAQTPTTAAQPPVAAIAPASPAAVTPAAPTSTPPVAAATPAPAAEPAASTTPPVAVAAAEPPVATPAPTVALDNTPPTIDAIELEGDRTFFAGAGPAGATMRLYVDDTFIADAKVEAGRWLVEAGKVLTEPSQRVRVDMLQPDSAKVASRAEVNFVVEMPTAEPPVAVATAEPAAQPTATPPVTQVTPPAELSPTEPAEAAPQPDPVPPAADKAADPAVPAAEPTAAAPADKAPLPAPATLDAATEPRTPTQTPTPVAPAPAPAVAATTPPAEMPSEPQAEPAETAVAEAEPAPTAEPATAAEAVAEVPTMVAVAIGSPDAERFVSGKAIIRRGDNLWTIARRTYGEGIKYTTIYQANTGQIRDPDRIYPGQVFELPETN